MSVLYATEKDLAWICAKCGEDLILKEVELEYMGSHFKISLPSCEKCGFTLVPEDLALGKMAEVEKLLEDK